MTVSSVSDNLRRVIDANARLWAGEAEVFTAYWNWSGRTRETDRQWLAYQCYKEVWSVVSGDRNGSLGYSPFLHFPKCRRNVSMN